MIEFITSDLLLMEFEDTMYWRVTDRMEHFLKYFISKKLITSTQVDSTNVASSILSFRIPHDLHQ